MKMMRKAAEKAAQETTGIATGYEDAWAFEGENKDEFIVLQSTSGYYYKRNGGTVQTIYEFDTNETLQAGVMAMFWKGHNVPSPRMTYGGILLTTYDSDDTTYYLRYSDAMITKPSINT